MRRLGTIELPAGDEIRLTVPRGVTLLLSIDAGTLDISTPGSTIEILGEDLAPMSHEAYAQVEADRAASIVTNGETMLRNAADHTVRVLLIATEPDPA